MTYEEIKAIESRPRTAEEEAAYAASKKQVFTCEDCGKKIFGDTRWCVECAQPHYREQVPLDKIISDLEREARNKRIAAGIEKPLASFGDRGLADPFGSDEEY